MTGKSKEVLGNMFSTRDPFASQEEIWSIFVDFMEQADQPVTAEDFRTAEEKERESREAPEPLKSTG